MELLYEIEREVVGDARRIEILREDEHYQHAHAAAHHVRRESVCGLCGRCVMGGAIGQTCAVPASYVHQQQAGHYRHQGKQTYAVLAVGQYHQRCQQRAQR